MYRQHPITLLWLACGCVVFGGIAAWLAVVSEEPMLFIGTGCAVLVLGIRVVKWRGDCILIEKGQVIVRSWGLFVSHEQVVSTHALGGVKLRQNMAGWLWNYGTLRIEVFGPPVHIPYLYPFDQLRHAIDGM